MGDENTSEVKKSPEMTPQDDGTKVPLTNDDQHAVVEGAKYVANPNGDAKIDVDVPTFSGMSKEELMKYSNDPFWVRLRWFLFILFWIGWLVMLIVAIVIIVQAPGCKPPPELLWVQEQPMVEVDPYDLPSKEELISKCKSIDIDSVYFPGLMSDDDFQEMKYNVKQLIDAVVNEHKEVVTDFPGVITSRNPFFYNASELNLVEEDGTWNYTNEGLPEALYKEIVEWWVMEGVKGFLMQDSYSQEKLQFRDEINELSMEKRGAVGSNVVDTKNKFFSSSTFKTFLEDQDDVWNFYKFSSNLASGGSISEENMRLVMMGLFLSPGTPMISDFETADNSTTMLLKHLTGLKFKNGIKFGATHFVNHTSEDIVAFTRVYKGTPAYAVALNFNAFNETVSFINTTNVGERGTVEIHSTLSENYFETRKKYNLDEVLVGPHEGIILQFVANFG